MIFSPKVGCQTTERPFPNPCRIRVNSSAIPHLVPVVHSRGVEFNKPIPPVPLIPLPVTLNGFQCSAHTSSRFLILYFCNENYV